MLSATEKVALLGVSQLSDYQNAHALVKASLAMYTALSGIDTMDPTAMSDFMDTVHGLTLEENIILKHILLAVTKYPDSPKDALFDAMENSLVELNRINSKITSLSDINIDMTKDGILRLIAYAVSPLKVLCDNRLLTHSLERDGKNQQEMGNSEIAEYVRKEVKPRSDILRALSAHGTKQNEPELLVLDKPFDPKTHQYMDIKGKQTRDYHKGMVVIYPDSENPGEWRVRVLRLDKPQFYSITNNGQDNYDQPLPDLAKSILMMKGKATWPDGEADLPRKIKVSHGGFFSKGDPHKGILDACHEIIEAGRPNGDLLSKDDFKTVDATVRAALDTSATIRREKAEMQEAKDTSKDAVASSSKK